MLSGAVSCEIVQVQEGSCEFPGGYWVMDFEYFLPMEVESDRRVATADRLAGVVADLVDTNALSIVAHSLPT